MDVTYGMRKRIVTAEYFGYDWTGLYLWSQHVYRIVIMYLYLQRKTTAW